MSQCSWKHFVSCPMLYKLALVMVVMVIIIVIASRPWVGIYFCPKSPSLAHDRSANSVAFCRVLLFHPLTPCWLLSIFAATTQVGASIVSCLEPCSPCPRGSPSDVWEMNFRSIPIIRSLLFTNGLSRKNPFQYKKNKSPLLLYFPKFICLSEHRFLSDL